MPSVLSESIRQSNRHVRLINQSLILLHPSLVLIGVFASGIRMHLPLESHVLSMHHAIAHQAAIMGLSIILLNACIASRGTYAMVVAAVLVLAAIQTPKRINPIVIAQSVLKSHRTVRVLNQNLISQAGLKENMTNQTSIIMIWTIS